VEEWEKQKLLFFVKLVYDFMFMDNSSIEGKSMDQEQSYLLEIQQQEELHYNIYKSTKDNK